MNCFHYYFSLGVEWLGHEGDHSPLSSAEVKNTWSYIVTPPHVLMLCLIKHRIHLRGVVCS